MLLANPLRSFSSRFRSIKHFIVFWAIFPLVLTMTAAAHSATVTLTWDPNTEQDLAGYKLYQGTKSGNYTSSVDAGNKTTCTLSNVEPGITYYYAATAYDTAGNESGYSGEVSYIAPTQETPPDGGTDISVRITSSSDDAEELFSGAMQLTSTDLDLGSKTVGVRFPAVSVPQGASITRAYIQFQANEIGVAPSLLTIEGENVDNAPAFTALGKDITARTRTNTVVSWSPASWTAVGQT